MTVTNTSQHIWLPLRAKTGAVQLGCHLVDEGGRTLKLDYFRHPLTPGEGREIHSGETLRFRIRVPAPPKGRYVLEFDLVSEQVCWFAVNGSPTVKVTVRVD